MQTHTFGRVIAVGAALALPPLFAETAAAADPIPLLPSDAPAYLNVGVTGHVATDAADLVVGTGERADHGSDVFLIAREADGSTSFSRLASSGFVPTLGVNERGDGAVAWWTNSYAYARLLDGGRPGKLIRLGRVGSEDGVGANPVVSSSPDHGRTTIMWRGRTSTGKSRIQWRITTGGKLGPVHTLGEDGHDLQLSTMPGGKSIAAWSGGSKRSKVRTAVRWHGEFTSPKTLLDGPQIVDLDMSAPAGDCSEVVLAFVPYDPDQPLNGDFGSGNAFTAARTFKSGFGTPAVVDGSDGTAEVSVASRGCGPALVSAVRVFPTATDDSQPRVVAASGRSSIGAPFPSFTTVDAGSPQAIRSTLGPDGRATLAWTDFGAQELRYSQTIPGSASASAPERLALTNDNLAAALPAASSRGASIAYGSSSPKLLFVGR